MFGIRQRFQLLIPLYYIILEVISEAVRQEKEIQGIKIRKEEIKLIIGINVYRELRESRLLESIAQVVKLLDKKSVKIICIPIYQQ